MVTSLRVVSSLLIIATVAASQLAKAQTDVKLTRVDPERYTPNRLFATYTGSSQAAQSQFASGGKWQAWRSDKAGPPYSEVIVNTKLDFSIANKIRVVLDDPSLSVNILECSFWTLQFTKDGQPAVPLTYSPPTGGDCQPPTTTTGVVKAAAGSPFLSPPGPNATPDVSVSGSFIAGGGTKPIYTFEVIAGLYAPNPVHSLLNFQPGVTTTVEINQGKTSSDRTTFDPDSITAAFALQRFVRAKRGNGAGLVGLELDEALPAGEFSRADPTSNIIFGSSAVFVFKPIRKAQSAPYGTIFPVLGVEVGRNLNRPSMIAKVPVDLTHYDTIFRGYGGLDAQFSVVDKTDVTSDSFTLSGSYRVRVPAFDEPFVKTMHQVTTVTQSTKARHWFEANANWAPWSFKYLSLNAKYQYGDLPPLFKLVNHSVSLGITFKATQGNKASRTDAP